VIRQHLLSRLNTGLVRKLTLVSAPAGFGKTSLVINWLSALDRPHVWLSLENSDNRLALFLKYLVAGLQQLETSVGQTLLNNITEPLPPVEVLITSLLNDLEELPHPYVLVLDDYHSINDLAVHQAVRYLLENLPRQMHLVIITREDPLLPLAQLRARGQLNELRLKDLRFTPEEAADFMQQTMQLELGPEELATVESRTEGWIAGLQLAALSLQDRDNRTGFLKNFGGDNRHIMDYLMDEVLTRQPAEIQQFLLKTSILERFCSPLCETLYDGEISTGYGQEMLEKLEQSNLFIIPLDSQRKWFRYHQLFAELLRHRLNRNSSISVHELHRRAGNWFRQNGLLDEALNYAFLANDYSEAISLIEEHGSGMIKRGETTSLLGWLEKLPQVRIFERPLLCVLYGWILLLTNPLKSIALIDELLSQAENLISAQIETSSSETLSLNNYIAGHIAAIQGMLSNWRGNTPEETARLLNNALSYLSDGELEIRSILTYTLGVTCLVQGDNARAEKYLIEAVIQGTRSNNYFIALSATNSRARMNISTGNLREAEAICREGLETLVNPLLDKGFMLPAAGLLQITLGRLLLERDNLADARPLLNSGFENLKFTGDQDIKLTGFLNLTRLLVAEESYSSAKELVGQLERASSYFHRYAEGLKFYIAVNQSAISSQEFPVPDRTMVTFPPELLESEILPPFMFEGEWQFTDLITWARYHLQVHSVIPDGILKTLENQLVTACRNGWKEREIEILCVQALLAEKSGAGKKALDTIQQALKLAEPEGYCRVFLQHGKLMFALLSRVVRQDAPTPLVEKLLRKKIATPEIRPHKAAVHRPNLSEPLSERELEVLDLIAEGLTNQEIASRLVLSLNTVKGHTRRIFDKLDVANRTQALAKARALGIFHPLTS
jgi:LuxR family maltose regulon positive regulatory protein